MSASEPPQDEYLTLVRGGAAARSARRGETGRERGQRSELKPGRKQVEVRVAGRGRASGGALRGKLDGDGVRVSATAESDGQQSSRVGQPLADEVLETKPQLRLVGARREVGHTAPLLTQRSKVRNQLLEGGSVRVEQELPPDRPERRRRLRDRLAAFLIRCARSLRQAFGHGARLEPGASVRNAGGAGNSGERADAHRVPEEPFHVGSGLHPEGSMEQVGPLGANTQRLSLEARRRAGRAGAHRVTTEQGREFVGSRESVRGLSQRGVTERGGRAFSGGKGREAKRSRHGVNRPVPIDEVRSAHGRGGEDRV